MRKIKLGKDKFALVDDEDFELLSRFKWHENNGYARTVIYLHSLVLKPEMGKVVDHKNLDRLDNRKENLRYASYSESQKNRRLQSNNTSGYRGVDFVRKNRKWRSQIKVKGKKLYLGTFDRLEDAVKAYDNAALKYFGDFARINTP